MSPRPAERALPLARLERWFQGEIARPHKAGAPAKDLVLPSRHLAPKERVAIYGRMVFARLRDALAEDYPAVVKLCGAEGFERLARAYLRSHPSRHYSLNFLGRKLPEFLDGPARIARRALLADVARVERAMSEAFDAPATAVLSPADMALIPRSSWEHGRIRLSESLRLLALDHRANAVVSACRKGEPLPALARQPTWVAVYRKEWKVWRMDLTRPMHAVLASLSKKGSLPAALAAAARVFDGDAEALQREVHRWFREWASEGLFRSVDAAASIRAPWTVRSTSASPTRASSASSARSSPSTPTRSTSRRATASSRSSSPTGRATC